VVDVVSEHQMSAEGRFVISTQRAWTLASLLVVVPLGFYSKLYAGPAANWVNNSLSGVLYVIFWCLLIFLLVPNAKPGIIALAVLAVTCALEFAQLWHPPALEWARSSFMGQALLGTCFTWSDFPYYVFGCGIGWLWMRWLYDRGKLDE
jgi:hypothetical protein